MKKSKLFFAALAGLGGAVGTVHDLHAAVVIQEVYGGGGSTSTTSVPTYNQDFIELYNNGTSSADISGDIVAYASSKSTTFSFSSTFNFITIPTFTLTPGGYYLIGGATSTTYTGAPLPVSVDQSSPFSISASAGEVGLFIPGTTGTPTISALDNVPVTGNTVALDGLGFGSVGQFETTSTAALTSTLAAYRTVLGVDSNANLADFTVGAVVAPINSGQTPEPATIGLAAVASAMMLRRRK